MRKVYRKLKILLLLSSLIFLYGCIYGFVVESIAVESSSLPDEIQISSFDLHDLILEVIYRNGTEDARRVSEDMLSESDRFKLTQVGTHTITVTYESVSTTFTITLLPDDIIYQPAQGLYDLRDISESDKAGLLAAMEGYLMENMYGGIPLYSFAQKVILSPRVDLLYDHHHPTLGFSWMNATLTNDDSSLLFYPGIYGSSGSYTLRRGITYEPPTLHPSRGNDSVTNDMLELLSGSLYRKVYNPSNDGYEIESSLAQGNPVAHHGVMINGIMRSSTWTINLKDGLKWQIPHGVNVLDDDITAEDFVWTFKQAILEGWPLATAGFYSLQKMGLINWDQVHEGIRSIDEIGVSSTSRLTIEFRFQSPKSIDELLSYLSQPSYSPVHREMYENLENEYGTSKATTPSAGLFYVSDWIHEDKIIFYSNPNHPDNDAISLTGFHYRLFNHQSEIYEAFMEDELDMAYIPISSLSNHPLGDRVIIQPSPYIWRLGINAFGTPERRDAYIDKYPELRMNPSYEPEPILMYQEMRQALYYAIDRIQMTDHGNYEFFPEGMILSSFQYINPYTNFSYRNSPQALALADEYMNDSFGFDPTRATALFKESVETALAEGYYQAGTLTDPTIIEITLQYQSAGNLRINSMMESIETMIETYLVDDVNHVNIDLILLDIAFPCCSSSPLSQGTFDLYLGAISGSLFDLPNYMKTMMDDAFISYPLNLGVATSSSIIEVSYQNLDGKQVYETWSYNALALALNGPIYVKEGDVQKTFDSPLELINALYIQEGVFASLNLNNRDDLISLLKSKSPASYAQSLGVDEVLGVVVSSVLAYDEFFILTKDDNLYQFHERMKIYTDRDDAIETFVKENFGNYDLISVTPLLTDADLQNDSYLSEWYDYDSLNELALDYQLDVVNMKVYSTTWSNYSSDPWNDVFIMFEIDGYYIPIDWL